jgi:hypothetical protein
VTGIWRFRAAVLTLGGLLLLHQGRYLLAPREHDHELHGVHVYLGWLMPLAAALLFLAIAQLAVTLRRGGRGSGPRLPSAPTLWAAATVTLLTAFGVQETLELTAVHGHLPEVADLLGHGGWQVVPLALTIGGAVALLLRGAARAIAWALRRRPPLARTAGPVARRPRAPLASRGSVVARNLAGRGPPSLA